jgi:alginate O-acetyltransferase complex protein AlgI
MRPFRSFLLLLLFLICFTGLYFIFPGNLNLPVPETFIPADLLYSFSSANLKDSKATGAGLNEPNTINTDTNKNKNSDTTEGLPLNQAPQQSYLADTAPSSSVLPNVSFLERFLDSLSFSDRQIRIMYYGDSQIEGDRVSSFLRANLRKEGAGTGPGLFLPVMPVTYTRSVYVRASSNWNRFTYLSFKNGEISHNALGPLMAFCRYLPENETSKSEIRAWVRIVPSKFADSTTSRYDFLRILYRNPVGKVKVDVKAGNLTVITDTLTVSPDLQEYRCPLYNAQNILIDFTGFVSPDIYGISIESKTGLIIDNIPQRGSAGLEFTMVDSVNLKNSLRFYSPDLIILQYGLNIVKNIRSEYSYYKKGLYRQISLLKDISPGSSFLVIGLTDMAYDDGGIIKSYPNIPYIIQAQRIASDESGALFWDAYKAMGGESSIIKWFEMDPPLAKKDLVHFTDQGADTLARMMLSDLFTRKLKPSAAISPVLSQKIDTSEIKTQNYDSKPEPTREKSFINKLLTNILSYTPGKPFIFTTPGFWIFFLFALAGFSLVYKRLFIRNIYLFLVSLFFYYKTGGLFLILLIIVTLIDVTCAILIYNSKSKFSRKAFIIISIISNIGILSYFKYTGFFIHVINSVLGTNFIVSDFLQAFSNNLLGTHFNIDSIILPVGISFFTFQSLSYTIDVYRRKLEPVRNIIDFGFYVSFFPQLVAGPIVRASEFIPQLYSDFSLNKREFGHALFLISKGLIKKIIISDFIAVNFVDRVFDLPTSFSGFENLMAVYGYGLQIYCDFSGYTDIAIGLALIMGFRLPVNFNSPYKATGAGDFWRRWHISLSRWLKDYLYIPLGGNRKGKVRTFLNLMITMLLGGLWHGANLRFIIWGGLHGIGLVVNKIWTSVVGSRRNTTALSRALSIFITFQFVSFCWIFFRSPDLHTTGLILRQIFMDFLPSVNANILKIYANVFTVIAAGYLIHFLPERLKESYRGLFIKIPLAVQFMIIMLMAIMLFQMKSSEIMPFIYFRF